MKCCVQRSHTYLVCLTLCWQILTEGNFSSHGASALLNVSARNTNWIAPDNGQHSNEYDNDINDTVDQRSGNRNASLNHRNDDTVPFTPSSNASSEIDRTHHIASVSDKSHNEISSLRNPGIVPETSIKDPQPSSSSSSAQWIQNLTVRQNNQEGKRGEKVQSRPSVIHSHQKDIRRHPKDSSESSSHAQQEEEEVKEDYLPKLHENRPAQSNRYALYMSVDTSEHPGGNINQSQLPEREYLQKTNSKEVRYGMPNQFKQLTTEGDGHDTTSTRSRGKGELSQNTDANPNKSLPEASHNVTGSPTDGSLKPYNKYNTDDDGNFPRQIYKGNSQSFYRNASYPEEGQEQYQEQTSNVSHQKEDGMKDTQYHNKTLHDRKHAHLPSTLDKKLFRMSSKTGIPDIIGYNKHLKTLHTGRLGRNKDAFVTPKTTQKILIPGSTRHQKHEDNGNELGDRDKILDAVNQHSTLETSVGMQDNHNNSTVKTPGVLAENDPQTSQSHHGHGQNEQDRGSKTISDVIPTASLDHNTKAIIGDNTVSSEHNTEKKSDDIIPSPRNDINDDITSEYTLKQNLVDESQYQNHHTENTEKDDDTSTYNRSHSTMITGHTHNHNTTRIGRPTQSTNEENVSLSHGYRTIDRKDDDAMSSTTTTTPPSPPAQQPSSENYEHVVKTETIQTEKPSPRSPNPKEPSDNSQRRPYFDRTETRGTELQINNTSRKIQRLDHVYALGLKTVRDIAPEDPEDELNYKSESVLPTPEHPGKRQVTSADVLNQVLKELMKQWTNNNTEKNQLKRRRRQAGSGDGPVIRKPVTNTTCRCKACASEQSAYIQGQYENAAFNKPAHTSSIFVASRFRSTGGCGAVNGDTSDRPSVSNCFQTRTGDRTPWFRVDLLYVYTFKSMKLIQRYTYLGGQRFVGTEVRVDGAICFQFPKDRFQFRSPKYSQKSFTITCIRTLTGRSVIFQKKHQVRGRVLQYLSFCELQIWVCKMGTYGVYPDGCKACTTSCKYLCSNFYGCQSQVLFNVAYKKPLLLDQGPKNDSYATDGDAEPISDQRCTTAHAQSRSQAPVLQKLTVYLETTFKIFSVNIYGRRQCCSEKSLKNVYVSVSNSSDDVTTADPPSGQKCGLVRSVPTRGNVSVSCSPPKVGRYVHLTKHDTSGLVVCEVEVFGNYVIIKNAGGKCDGGSEAAVCPSTSICEDGQCKISVGNRCKKDQPCVNGTICDRAKCKINADLPCDPKMDHCKSGTVCDTSSQTCKLGLRSRCTEQGQCETRAVCDVLSQCKLKESETCSDETECQAGAKCTGGKCVCDSRIGDLVGDRCKPSAGRIGSACSGSGCQFGQCEGGRCVCGAGYSTFAEDFSCKLKAGSSCGGDSDCNTGLKCEDKKCRVNAGGNCYGNSQFCISGTTCESDTCKLNTGKKCTNHEDLCLPGNLCADGTCKIELGEDCENSREDCYESVCSSDDNNTCKLDAGHNCTSDYARQCRNGTTCENGQVCKLDLGQPCSNTSKCMTGTVCDARQGSSDKKCRKTLGKGGCRMDEDCVSGTVCDHEYRCMIAKDGKCQRHPGPCLIGAVCTNGTCQCIQKLTMAGTEKCEPKPSLIGGKCEEKSGKEGCDDIVALCGADGRCHCTDSFAADRTDLTCRTRAGSPCSASESLTSDKCVSGAVCTDGFCSLEVGEFCFGKARGDCKIGTVCDIDEVCRLNLHQNCSGEEAHCQLDIVCDSLKRCKLRPGNFCRIDDECMAGAHCDRSSCVCTETVSTLSDGTCELKDGLAGGNCDDEKCLDERAECNDQGKCQCQPGYAPDARSLSCRKKADEQCSADSECTTGMICDRASKKCRIQVGQMCDGENKDYCMTGTVCDFDSVCKLDLKGDCGGDNYAFCRRGTFCDRLEQCSLGVGDACNLTESEESCSAGARCIESTCVCDTRFSTDSGAVCDPNSGRHGAECGTTIGRCTVEHSECIDNTCVCKTGYRPNWKFSCENPTPPTKSGKKVFFFVILLLLAACLVFGVISFIAYKRCQHKKKELRNIVSERRASLKELQKLVGDDGRSETVTETVASTSVQESSDVSFGQSGTVTSESNI